VIVITTGMFRINIIRGNQTNTNELDGTCGTYVGELKCGRGFGGGNQRQRDNLDYLGVDGFSGNGWGGGGNGLN